MRLAGFPHRREPLAHRREGEGVDVERRDLGTKQRVRRPGSGTELNKRRNELAMAAGGSDALEWESGAATPRSWLRSKGNSIEGGTSEIQLNIVAKHILRLPGA